MNKIYILITILFVSSCILDDSISEMHEVDSDEQPLSASMNGGTHCVVDVQAIPGNEPVPAELAPAPDPTCFRSFADAIEFATAGRVRLPQSATIDDVDDQLLNGNDRGAMSVYLIAIEYQHWHYLGSTMTYRSIGTCYDYAFALSSMSSGWNDIISSSLAFAGCRHSYHYEHINYGGRVVDCYSGCYYIGDTMNDRTSSLYWTL